MCMKRLFLTAALSGLSLASAQTAPADLGGTLTLYTSEVQADVQTQVDAFKKLYPRADVQLFRSGTGEVTAKLNAELEAGNSQADLLWVADQTYFDTLSKRTLLEKLDLSGLNVPGSAVYGGTYAEVRKLYNVIGVNTNVLKIMPKSFADLKQPAYQNKLAMPNPLFSGGALSTAGTLAQRLGWDYFDALAKNGMKIE